MSLISNKIKFSKVAKLILVLLVLLFTFVGYRIISKSGSSKEEIAEQNVSLATVKLGKSIELSAPKATKKGQQQVKFTILSAELRSEIKVKSVPRTADKTQQFILLRLEIENNTTDRLTITPSEFIRLVGEEDKKFAPDFHNATVLVDPLSVRKDLVSFVVPKEKRSFTILVGELKKEKETIVINF